MNHAQKARDLFLSGCSCSQAVFAAFAEDFGIDQDAALKLASSFGGGMGGMRETCGAVSGMLMVAGLKWGYSEVGNLDIKTVHYARVRSLIEAFKQEHSTIVCRELLAHLGELKKIPARARRSITRCARASCSWRRRQGCWMRWKRKNNSHAA